MFIINGLRSLVAVKSFGFTGLKLSHRYSFIVLLVVTFNAIAQENGQLREFSPPNTIDTPDYYIPPVAQRQTLEEGGFKIRISDIQLVSKQNTGSDNIIESRVTEPQVLSLVSDKMTENAGEFTINELNSLAGEISAKFRELGFLLTSAYIPSQELDNGVLTIEVLQGVLGNVLVSGNNRYSENLFSNEFNDLKGKVVKKDEAERALLLVRSRIPGAVSQGIFAPGEQLGLSDLEVKIANEDTFRGVSYIDNYGSAFTGELRTGVHLDFLNLLGYNDSLSMDLVLNEKPEGVDENGAVCCFGGFRYEFIGEDLVDSFGVEFTRSTYDVGNGNNIALSVLGLEGETQKLRFFGTRILNFSRSFQAIMNYGVSNIHAEASSIGGGADTRDEIGEYDLGVTYNYFDSQGSYRISGDLSLHFKPNQSEGSNNPLDVLLHLTGYDDDVYFGENPAVPTRLGTGTSATFRVLAEFNYRRDLTENLNLHLQFKGQYSDDALAPIQQFGIAGPNAVRFLETGTSLADTAFVTSINTTYQFSRGSWEMFPSVFVDYGYARENSVPVFQPVTQSVTALGAGFAFKAIYEESLELSLSYALDARDLNDNDRLAQSSSDEDYDSHLFGSIVYRF